jgi:CBS domain containing-hemolysin-like protein
VYVLLALALLRAILVYKVYNSVPSHELKRRARLQDKRAMALHKVASFDSALQLQYWVFATTVATILFIWSARTSWWLAALVIVIISWLIVWADFSAEGWAGRVAAFFAPIDTRILTIGHPIFSRISTRLPSHQAHTKVYDKTDLLDLVKKQNRQINNRIPPTDLEIAHNAMTFGDKPVSSIMTPRNDLKLVKASDAVGPLLMDELHSSGHSRFPVTSDSGKTESPEIIGTLYLNNLLGYEGNARAGCIRSVCLAA